MPSYKYFSTWEPLSHLKNAMKKVKAYEKGNQYSVTKNKVAKDSIKQMLGGTSCTWIGEPILSKYGNTYYGGFK